MEVFEIDAIEDEETRKNFQRLSSLVQSNPFLNSEFRHFEVTLNQADSAYRLYHGLGFVPKDIVLTNVSDGATVTVTYASVTRDYVQFNVSAACTFRCLIGAVVRRND